MTRGLKYYLLLFAAIVVVLHNIIPHVHKSNLSSYEHQEVHQVEQSTLNLLALAFHEFTEEGQMEDFVVHGGQSIQTLKETVVDLATVVPVLSVEQPEQIKLYPFNDPLIVRPASGYGLISHVRPPPVA
ncbi:MAG: hypothetical protein KDD41_10435 [Flavobacteriales bacterium]|nr:hypothetical protein [Flavobacteriales bacterium]